MGSRCRRLASSTDSGAHTMPEVWRMKKAIFSGVHMDAATNRSPSFSRSSSSATTTISPRANAAATSSTSACDSRVIECVPGSTSPRWGGVGMGASAAIPGEGILKPCAGSPLTRIAPRRDPTTPCRGEVKSGVAAHGQLRRRPDTGAWPTGLILRSPRSGRLEGWLHGNDLCTILRDADLWSAPQDVVHGTFATHDYSTALANGHAGLSPTWPRCRR